MSDDRDAADIDAWLDSIDPDDPSIRVYDGAPARRMTAAAEELRAAVIAAREVDYRWEMIAVCLDMSVETAKKLFGDRDIPS